MHADWHAALTSTVGGQRRVFGGTDGGIFSSTNVFSPAVTPPQVVWHFHNRGLVTHMCNSIGSGDPATGNPFVVVTGMQDNGARFRDSEANPTVFDQVIGGDGEGGSINRGTAGEFYWSGNQQKHFFCFPAHSMNCLAPGAWVEMEPPIPGGSPVIFHATSLGALAYTDPPAGGKLRLVRDASSTGSTVALKLVANAAMNAYSAGFNLPLDATKVRANATLLTPGTALPPGSSPAAAKAVLPTSGPLQGVLVAGQSQKRSGAGAVAADTAIAAGDIQYTIRLDLALGIAAGTVFDGSALPARFNGGVRNLAGTDVAGSGDFAIGKLEVQ